MQTAVNMITVPITTNRVSMVPPVLTLQHLILVGHALRYI